MTYPGQPDPKVEVDLTASPLESTPSLRGFGQDIEARFALSILGKLFRFGMRVQDKTAQVADGVTFMIVTWTTMGPILVTLLVCYVAHASTASTIALSLSAGAIYALIAFALLRLCRRRPDYRATNGRIDRDQGSFQQMTTPPKRSKNAKRHKRSRPHNRRR